MPSKYTTLIQFHAHSGTVYELTVELTDPDMLGNVPVELHEDESGRIFPVLLGFGRSPSRWDSLIEMTHDLKIEIVSWGSDVGD